MKVLPWRFCGRQCAVFTVASLLWCAPASAQTSGLVPVVTVQATQPFATPTNPGVFTVFRAGNTDATLNVWYDLGGSASNGVDYALIPPHLVAIAAGTTSSAILITPAGNPAASFAKTVELKLGNSPLMTPVNYQIGSPSSAVVYLQGGPATNRPPAVAIIAPKEGAVFYSPTNIQILAKAGDPDGTVTNVEFFAGPLNLGKGLPVVLDPPGVNGIVGLVYWFNWLGPLPGSYPLTAVAADNGGASTLSAPVNVLVRPGPPTNLPPVVRLVSPANGTFYHAPVNLPLYAFASDPDGLVTAVQFFADTNAVGYGQRVPVAVPLANGSILLGGPVPPVYPTNVFFLIWSNVPAGKHVLTAEATDDGQAVSVSEPVNIAVLPPLPPPTNRPAIVNLVATDPVAMEGTNCVVWSGESNSPPSWATWPAAAVRLFTNCGPKTATFTLRRFGETNGELTVLYAIGGTARNGVDYLALPDRIAIPAGGRSALITIMPIDDGPPDLTKTVVLTLMPPTNRPPDYLLGQPARAAAIILDRAYPRPPPAVLPDGAFHLTAAGPDAAWFRLEYSTDLMNWTPVCTNQVIQGAIDFVDPEAPDQPHRYYRAVPLTDAPAE